MNRSFFRTAHLLLSSLPRIALLAGALGSLELGAAAQGFCDGDLILANWNVQQQRWALLRANPETGTTSVLVDNVNPNVFGALAYDSHRGKVVANYGFFDLPLGGAFQLVQIDAAGIVSPLGVQDSLHGIAPAGDGRIFFQSGTVGLNHVRYLDASNQQHVLLDAQSGLPYEHFYYFAIYDPSSNALITSGPNVGASCGPGDIRFTRLQLTPDGTAVSGSTCTSYDMPSNEASNGFDRLPNGAIITSASHAFIGTEALLELNPLTLAKTVWANPAPISFLGVLWSQRLGRVVLADNGNQALKTFTQLQGGAGQTLALDVPFSAPGMGIGWFQTVIDVNVFGPGCGGLAETFGSGSLGTGGFVPQLTATACPRLGANLPLSLTNALGGSVAIFAYGIVNPSLPLFGGTLYVNALGSSPAFLSGPAGQAGAGQANKSFGIPNNPSLLGLPIYLQAAAIDAAAIGGISLSNGLEVRAS